MATLRDIKNRIRGVKSTQQITKAMKMVAAAKLRRAQEAITNARPYSKKLSSLLAHLVTDQDLAENPYLVEREVKNVALVVISADRGLCGAFNTNIIKEAVRYSREEVNSNVNLHLFCVGRKGYEFFGKRDYDLAGHRSGIFGSLKYDEAQSISDELVKQYLDGTFDKIVIIFNEFKSVIQQKLVTEQFLPIPINKASEESKHNMPDYIYEPGQKEIFNELLPKFLRSQIWRMLLESNASEQGARMTAMDNATTNAKELIKNLQLTYNKERQAAITKEILEIVSGANALQAG